MGLLGYRTHCKGLRVRKGNEPQNIRTVRTNVPGRMHVRTVHMILSLISVFQQRSLYPGAGVENEYNKNIMAEIRP